MPRPPPLATLDGSLTVHSPRYGQSYGSRFGAASQARQVFVQGSGTHLHPAPRVLVVGFGLGQNFRETLWATTGRPLHYLAYEFDPLPPEMMHGVAAPDPLATHPAWAALLERWGQPISTVAAFEVVLPDLTLELRREDVTLAALPTGWASAVYLDGFSPDVNPEVWEGGFLARLARTLHPGGVLVTYSAAGQVRRSLTAAGLQVERCPGPAGKREVLRAIKP